MTSRHQTRGPGGRCLLALILVVAGAAPALADDSIVYFKNGRALRVLDTRAEGEWVYLLISEPRPTGRKAGEEEPSELWVRADSIARIEGARTAAPTPGPGGHGLAGRAANGVVREHSEADAMAAALSSRPGGGTMDEAAEMVPNVPAMGSPEAKLYKPSTYDAGIPDDIKPGSSTAGYEIRAPLRNMRPPRHILERAKQLQEQRRMERAARQAAEAQPAPPPPQQPAPPPPPEGGDGSGS